MPMLRIESSDWFVDCDGVSRRNFLQVGTLGLGGWTLADSLAAQARAADSTRADHAVVWIWLGGGPTHIETFDPKLTAPAEYRSVTGEVATSIAGVTFGGTFPKLAEQADKLTVVRSFAHTNSGHGGGTHFVMTGYDNRGIDNGGQPTRPSMGSILARVRGANHPRTGMPTYIRLNAITADGPAFLGTAYAPFDPSGPARRNLTLELKQDRLDDRRGLLSQLDRFQREADQQGLMNGLDAFEQQAFQVLLGNAPAAFDFKNEDPRLLAKYGVNQDQRGRGSDIGQQLVLARRLVECGCGFVTLHYGGWDMHGNIKRAMEQRSPALDQALAAFLDDVWARGLNQKLLVVVSGEFGRTPRVNKGAGRDHWAPLSTLALAGGRLPAGAVIGESMAKADVPKTRPIRPQDLMATIFDHLGIEPKTQFLNQARRPVYLLEEGRSITALA
jgi:uncharacterized protein (DUF1501 family)